MKIGIRSAGVPCSGVAALAEKRNLSDQKLAMITSVDFVAVQAVLLNGRMLKCIGPSLFGMTLIAEVIDRIRFHHLWPKASMDLMATAAFYPALFYRMA